MLSFVGVMSYVSILCTCAGATQSDSTLQSYDTYSPMGYQKVTNTSTKLTMCFVAQLCFDVPLFVCVRSVNVHSLVCAVCPIWHSNMAQIPLAALCNVKK